MQSLHDSDIINQELSRGQELANDRVSKFIMIILNRMIRNPLIANQTYQLNQKKWISQREEEFYIFRK